MWEDPIVAEVRRVREQLAAKFGYDVKAMFDDMRRRQATSGARVVSPKKRAEPTAQSESADDVCDLGPIPPEAPAA